jgi:hypothetical protein
VEYIEGGNEGPEAGEIPEIEFEGYEEPDTSGSVIAHINEVVHNGTNLYFKIRNEKQIAELKNIGLVLSPSRFSDLVKCPCAKNAWAKNKEAAVKICIYVKRLIAEAKQVRFKVKSLVKE